MFINTISIYIKFIEYNKNTLLVDSNGKRDIDNINNFI